MKNKTSRVCKICEAEKPISEYYKTSRGYPTSYCKPCHYADNRRRLKAARANEPIRTRELALIPDPFEKKKSGPATIISTEFLWSVCV